MLSKVKARFSWSRSWAFWAVSMAMCTAAHSQNQQPTPTSPEAVAAQMWKKIVSVCPISGEGGTATVFAFPVSVLSEAPAEWRWEFREAWTKLYPKDLSSADRLNGLQFYGYAVLGGALYRMNDGTKWSEWKDGVSKKVADASKATWRPRDDKYPKNFADTPSVDADMRWNVHVIIEERGGRWSFRNVRGWGNVAQEFDPDEIAAKRKSCDLLLK